MPDKYRLCILTSLCDDFATQLLQAIDENVSNSTISADVYAVCNRTRMVDDTAFHNRLSLVRSMKNFAVKEFDSRSYQRTEHDKAMVKILPKADSYLNVGYMYIITEDLCNRFDIINLHPAIPEIGPIGMWPNVMEEQAYRPLEELAGCSLEPENISSVLQKREYKAGGMLHIVTPETDRGPVIAYYEFALTSPRLVDYCKEAAERIRKKYDTCDVKKKLAQEIRNEQFKGEEPLLIITYDKLTHGEWEIRNRTLYTKQADAWIPQPSGCCLNKEISMRLGERNIPTLI